MKRINEFNQHLKVLKEEAESIANSNKESQPKSEDDDKKLKEIKEDFEKTQFDLIRALREKFPEVEPWGYSRSDFEEDLKTNVQQVVKKFNDLTMGQKN